MYMKFNEYEKNMLEHIIQYGEEEDRERTLIYYKPQLPVYILCFLWCCFVFMQK